MGEQAEKNYPSIRVTVLTFFLLATTLTAGLAIGLQYYFGHQQARDSARTLYTVAAASVASELQGISERNTNLIGLMAENPSLESQTERANQTSAFAAAMRNNPLIHAIYLAHEDGTFFQLINLESGPAVRQSYRATSLDRWVTVTVSAHSKGRNRHFDYLDANLNLSSQRDEATDYDHRSRAWYSATLASKVTEVSAPYLFAHLKVVGRTISRRVGAGDTIVAMDMTLKSMSAFLQEQEAARFGELLLYSQEGEVIASSRSVERRRELGELPELLLTEKEKALVAVTPALKVSNEMNWPPLDYAVSGEPEGYAIDLMRMLSAMTGLEFEFVNGLSWPELVENFRQGKIDILHPIHPSQDRQGWGVFSEEFLNLKLAVVRPEGVEPVVGLSQLAGKKLAIPKGWATVSQVKKHFPEIEVVETENTLEAMRKTLDGSVDAAMDNEIILRYLANYYFLQGLSYSVDPDMGGAAPTTSLHLLMASDKVELLALLNRAIASIGPRQHESLRAKWMNFEQSLGSGDTGAVPHSVFLDIARDSALESELHQIEHNGQTFYAYGTRIESDDGNQPLFGVLVPEQSIVGPFMERLWLSILITGGFLMLIAPLSWFFANPIVSPIKQLARENDKVRERRYTDVRQVKTQIKELDDLSESMVDMVESISAYELAQRKLMDSFIQLIAEAIDEKSPYTGGHCERVPELALMLAKHADASALPAFETFVLKDEDAWREYRIAAWLHDCGKITTPEHIVDKGSKLEVIYNRIHEVRTRFEVLWRDAEIQCLKNIALNPQDEDVFRAELGRARQTLQDDFAFIAECNVGGEFLDKEKQAHLRLLGERIWTRHFDDKIGLSPVEELRVKAESASAPAILPVEEKLLQDRPDHIIPRTRSTDYPPEFGIDMEIPEHLYNQGEIYNLSVSRGTLTQEDRFKINEHMISTIKMLESLPFPEELKNVPRYASTHHETMRGSGYPRKLQGDQLSIAERILAIADVFEALTASDRPYKKAKPVSVALDILHKMVEDQHLDSDCFQLFIRSGVYREYAEAFLEPSQIDEVDIGKYGVPA
jgi:HD-GYP domain-containing protein (c-di-GMP phosphodiesterase class II)/ABC-type amino acid transport substrate-binding protein